jgi:DNA polymerase-3 subunit gamma/tau
MQLCSLNAPGIEAEKKNDISEPALKPQITSAPVSTPSVSTAQTVSTTQNTITPIPGTTTPVTPQPQISVTQVQEKPAVAAVTVAKKPIIKTSTPSINQHINPAGKIENDAASNSASLTAVSQKAENFTQEQLENAWLKYSNELKAKGKANLGLALSTKMPVLKEHFKVEFAINNKALEEAINEDKMNFLGFLRNELSNFSIQLELTMAQTEDKANLYTATDRYKRLAEKNPAINKFRQAFDLDIEF